MLLLFLCFDIHYADTYVYDIHEVIRYEIHVIWYVDICRVLIDRLYNLTKHRMIWDKLIWYGMIWYDMVWYDMICYDMIFMIRYNTQHVTYHFICERHSILNICFFFQAHICLHVDTYLHTHFYMIMQTEHQKNTSCWVNPREIHELDTPFFGELPYIVPSGYLT